MKSKLQALIEEYKKIVNILSSHIPDYEDERLMQYYKMEKLRIRTYKKIIYDLEKIVLNKETRPAGHLP